MKTKKDFYKFVNRNKHNIRKFGNNVGKNCIGTALYLVGELPEEKFVYGEQTDSILKNLKEDNVPNLGNLVAWQDGNGETYHLAVVVKTNPTLLAHRYRFNSGFFSKWTFEDVDSLFSIQREDSKVKYLIPSKLQKILDKEAQN